MGIKITRMGQQKAVVDARNNFENLPPINLHTSNSIDNEEDYLEKLRYLRLKKSNSAEA